MPEAGSLLKWHREPGQTIKVGDLLCEVETDKTVVSVEAEIEGTLEQILVAEGAAGLIAGQVLARLRSSEIKAAGVPDQRAPSAPLGIDGRGRLAASPRARRLARQSGLDLKTIAATGPRGRIVERDVIKARAASQPSDPAPRQSSGMPSAQVHAPHPQASEVIVLDGMRRTIAERLTVSKQSVPHFYMTAEVELDALVDLRRRVNEDLSRASGDAVAKLSINDWIIKALGNALIANPDANAIWDSGSIRRLQGADVGVAVAVPGGLYTPVVRGVEFKSLTAISREIKALSQRARDRELRSNDCQGGASTVSNLGMFGVDQFTAIINPPQSSIFAIGAARQRPTVRHGQLCVATAMTITLSCDHRIIDGAVGAGLLGTVKRMLETPFALIT